MLTSWLTLDPLNVGSISTKADGARWIDGFQSRASNVIYNYVNLH